ncbi:hypothetical protein K488DRAFT_82009 [Vararia minispora EC-137]|uniref:Uncharacterized protein n=1 Tax=Vararia minispora EC-137 TaxID=1314806 RepID=A0ACB8QXK2_9AGAM|nr:hypothetical protein K488DRAFT_82009 [Vararia minispora EC-137]
MAHQLATSPKLAKVDLSRLRSMNSGAAYLPPEIRERLIKRAENISHFGEGYGMSECTVAAVVQPFPGTIPSVTEAPGFTGVLLPSMKARVVREDGSDAGWDEPGELLICGDNIALGYHKNEKATRETFVNGWLHTGDRFRVDRHGRFFYCDRAKDTLKVSGTQVSPVEIEDTILAHPEGLASDVAVAGVPGARMLDERVPRAWVTLSLHGKRKGERYVAKALDEWVRTTLSRPKWLRGGVQVIDEIPKSPTGKVLRRKLQEAYEAAALKDGRVRSKL